MSPPSVQNKPVIPGISVAPQNQAAQRYFLNSLEAGQSTPQVAIAAGVGATVLYGIIMLLGRAANGTPDPVAACGSGVGGQIQTLANGLLTDVSQGRSVEEIEAHYGQSIAALTGQSSTSPQCSALIGQVVDMYNLVSASDTAGNGGRGGELRQSVDTQHQLFGQDITLAQGQDAFRQNIQSLSELRNIASNSGAFANQQAQRLDAAQEGFISPLVQGNFYGLVNALDIFGIATNAQNDLEASALGNLESMANAARADAGNVSGSLASVQGTVTNEALWLVQREGGDASVRLADARESQRNANSVLSRMSSAGRSLEAANNASNAAQLADQWLNTYPTADAYYDAVGGSGETARPRAEVNAEYRSLRDQKLVTLASNTYAIFENLQRYSEEVSGIRDQARVTEDGSVIAVANGLSRVDVSGQMTWMRVFAGTVDIGFTWNFDLVTTLSWEADTVAQNLSLVRQALYSGNSAMSTAQGNYDSVRGSLNSMVSSADAVISELANARIQQELDALPR